MINTKCNPVIRSFLGGFFGALMAIIPASIYNHFWLCLAGATLGWVVGYHGDRIFYGLSRGWLEAGQRMKVMKNILMSIIALIMGKTPKLNKSNEKILNFFRQIKSSFDACAKFIDSVKNIFVRLFCFLFVNLPKRCLTEYRKDEINKINLFSYAIFTICALVMIGVIYTIIGFTEPVTKERGFPTIILSAFLVLMPLLVCCIGIDERSRKQDLYLWDSYHQSLGRFVFSAILFYLHATLWVAVGIVFTCTALFVGIFGFLLIGACGMGLTLIGIRFSWHLVRMNKDYGIISLVVALIVGTTTFFIYREQLISNMSFLLTASIVSAFISGLASFGFTYLGALLFNRVAWLKNLMELKEEDCYVEWAMIKSFDLVFGKLGMYCLKKFDPMHERLIPHRILF